MSEVYVIKAGDRLKIGVSGNLRNRLDAIQTGCSDQLVLLATVPGGYRLENAIHRQLHRHCCRGEWFKDNDEVRSVLVHKFGFHFPDAPVPPTPAARAEVKSARVKLSERLLEQTNIKIRTAALAEGTPEHKALAVEAIRSLLDAADAVAALGEGVPGMDDLPRRWMPPIAKLPDADTSNPPFHLPDEK